MEETKTKKPRGLAAMTQEDRQRIARLGGLASSSNRAHMQEIGRKGGSSLFKNRGREYFQEIGRSGAKAVAAKKLAQDSKSES